MDKIIWKSFFNVIDNFLLILYWLYKAIINKNMYEKAYYDKIYLFL